MAIQTTINPYSGMGTYLGNGLDYVITNIAGTPPDVDNLNDVLYEYFTVGPDITFGNNSFSEIELKSFLPLAINGYINQEYNIGSPAQAAFLSMMVSRIKSGSPLDIPDIIADMEDNIGKSDLSKNDQIPLFFATAVGLASYNYWLGEIGASPASDWADYFNSNYAVNLANIPNWVAATMIAAVYNFRGDWTTDQQYPPKIAGPAFITALHAAIGIAAGKVMFGWVQRVKMPSLSLNAEVIAGLNDEEAQIAGITKTFFCSKVLCPSSKVKGICICRPSENTNCTHGVTTCPQCPN